MTVALALAGWAMAGGLALLMRVRLERVARAEHELRGPATVIGLACERLRRSPDTRRQAEALDAELARLRAGLADLTAARSGRFSVAKAERVELEKLAAGVLAGWHPALAAGGRDAKLNWRAGRVSVVAARGRPAQALGNLLANAAEHGAGPLELRGRRVPGAVRVEVRNRTPGSRPRSERSERGRGLGIAARAARSAGGRLELAANDGEVVAALELPLRESIRTGSQDARGPQDSRPPAGRPASSCPTDEPPAAA